MRIITSFSSPRSPRVTANIFLVNFELLTNERHAFLAVIGVERLLLKIIAAYLKTFDIVKTYF